MFVYSKRKQALEAPPPVQGAVAHLHLKGQTHTKKTVRFRSPSKSNNFNMLYKNTCGVFWAKISHTHTLGTSKTYFTSCERALYHPFK